ncbi:hypothetical protein GQ457_01G024690 [Hibiscus cannabinus]
MKLIEEDSRGWNRHKLEMLFSPLEVEAIFSIPIGSLSMKDVLIWARSRDGKYTVKYGCYFLSCSIEYGCISFTSHNPSRKSHVWRSLWGMNVLPKIRSFLWKL